MFYVKSYIHNLYNKLIDYKQEIPLWFYSDSRLMWSQNVVTVVQIFINTGKISLLSSEVKYFKHNYKVGCILFQESIFATK